MTASPNDPVRISITDVTKIFTLGIFKKKTAVSGLTLQVNRGMVLGLLGPNGSGKSTTLKMMLGFLKPTSGEILVCGHPSHSRLARTFIGYLPENPRFQKFLTGRDILYYYGKLLGLKNERLGKRIPELLGLVNLTHAANERVHGYSKGMTQRLAIAQALLNDPPILVFDEPMSGLDPIGRIEIRNLIRQIHERSPSTTIFFSTHILEDVEHLCTDVALLKKGQLATYGPIEKLLLRNEERYDLTLHSLEPTLEKELLQQKRSFQSPLGLTVQINGTTELVKQLDRYQKLGVKVVGISSHRRSLEEALFTESHPFEPNNQPPREVMP